MALIGHVALITSTSELSKWRGGVASRGWDGAWILHWGVSSPELHHWHIVGCESPVYETDSLLETHIPS
jgi:hypothetical protein